MEPRTTTVEATSLRWFVTVKGYGGRKAPHVVNIECFSIARAEAVYRLAHEGKPAPESQGIVEYEGMVQAVLPMPKGG